MVKLTGIKTGKTPAKIANQERHNRNRRERRAEIAKQKHTTPRAGACEEIVHKMVSGIVTRLLKRKRNNAARKKDPNGVLRAKKWHDEQKVVAAEQGVSITEHLNQRQEEHATKPLVYYNAQERHKERMATDENYSIRVRLSRRLREFLRLRNGTKAEGTMELVGCTQEELVAHLHNTTNADTLLDESIDHIFPASAYDARDPHQRRQMMHWSNLRMMPLYGVGGNVSKNNSLPTAAEASGVERWAWPSMVTENMLV